MSDAPPRLALGILGPTAIGKTALAMTLARELPVRLISVDSAMVYRGMDIGTAKPSPAELARYPHALVDILDPAERYSAAQFLADARRELQAAFAAGQLPVFVGGTMLYFKALRDGLATMPAAVPAVRAELQGEVRHRGLAAMHLELARLDPVAAAAIAPQNGQRLLRALEVYRVSGKPISSFWQQPQRGLLEEFGGSLQEVMLLPTVRATLHRRIAARLDHMVATGFTGEVRRLYERGDLHTDLPAVRCVGYRQFWEHAAGRCDLATASAAAVVATRQLAKRQLTWLRRWRDLPAMTAFMCPDDAQEAEDAGSKHTLETQKAKLLHICNIAGVTP